jgi:hypothetical protein
MQRLQREPPAIRHYDACMSNVAMTRYDAALVRERTYGAAAASHANKMNNDRERSDEY